MEAFQVFATLNLVDLMSGPLGRVQAAMAATKGHAAGLGDSMGRLAGIHGTRCRSRRSPSGGFRRMCQVRHGF